MKKLSNCLYCNKEFVYCTTRSTGKFCSVKCSSEYKVNTVSKNRIENGLVDQPQTLKTYLTNIRGYKCEECDIFEWRGKKLSLHLDHIDGNSDNNLPSNIRLLCPNCHSLTDTYTGRNTKNTKRSSYSQRYRKRMIGT